MLINSYKHDERRVEFGLEKIERIRQTTNNKDDIARVSQLVRDTLLFCADVKQHHYTILAKGLQAMYDELTHEIKINPNMDTDIRAGKTELADEYATKAEICRQVTRDIEQVQQDFLFHQIPARDAFIQIKKADLFIL